MTQPLAHAISVLGAARSGLAAANALVARGHDVLLSDLRSAEALAPVVAGLDPRVTLITGRNVVRPGDLVIISPGIKPQSATFRLAHTEGSEVISDIELFYRLSPAPMLAVTGTDGKSTTTALLAQILQDAGRPTFVGGNIGIGIMSGLADLSAEHAVVAEISCFQLIHCPTLRPRVSVYTNIAEDHIDYHGSFEAYQAAKRALMAQQQAGDVIVLNADDDHLSAWPLPPGPLVMRYSRRGRTAPGAWWADDVLHYALPGASDRALLPAAALRITGPHNIENALAAAAAALAFGIPEASVAETLRTFPGLEHRIEYVADIAGVAFYNDSKATNPHAALAGLTAFGPRPLVAICGGSEKGSDFSELGRVLAERAAGVVLIGQTAERIAAALPAGPGPAVARATDIDAAVAAALQLAPPGGVVTLCPACASFDWFRDFEHRGREFKRAVQALQAARAAAEARP